MNYKKPNNENKSNGAFNKYEPPTPSKGVTITQDRKPPNDTFANKSNRVNNPIEAPMMATTPPMQKQLVQNGNSITINNTFDVLFPIEANQDRGIARFVVPPSETKVVENVIDIEKELHKTQLQYNHKWLILKLI